MKKLLLAFLSLAATAGAYAQVPDFNHAVYVANGGRNYYINRSIPGATPGIPNETEVIEKGIDVGEMNKLLLQKVEEQMLYIIEMKKQIDEMRKEMDTYKKK